VLYPTELRAQLRRTLVVVAQWRKCGCSGNLSDLQPRRWSGQQTESSDTYIDVLRIFRRAFQARFKFSKPDNFPVRFRL
jgi:hypothetical protein